MADGGNGSSGGAIADLSKARILVTNDDSIQAHGIRVLEDIARGLSDDVWVIAPEHEQSGASHSLTLRLPLRLKQYDERRFSVDGTPTDCVLMAVGQVLKGHKPDLVLSGINHGANLGEDVTYSGTVAAAMEGALLGVRSIALSLDIAPTSTGRWHTPQRHAPALIRRLAAADTSANTLVNVNFPDRDPDDVDGVEVAVLGRRKLGEQMEERLDPRGEPYYWIGPLGDEDAPAGTDLAAIAAGRISVTPVHLDLTDLSDMPAVENALA